MFVEASTKLVEKYCLLPSSVAAGLDAGGPLTLNLACIYSADAHPPCTGKIFCSLNCR